MQRRTKYIIQSLVSLPFLYYLSQKAQFSWEISLVLVVLFVISLSFWSHWPNINIKNVFFGDLLPITLFCGTLFFLKGYPTLSPLFIFAVLAGFSLFYYIVLLVDNIFLVVRDREQSIPLHRAAVTWGQILCVVIAVPLFSGIFKFNTNFLVQAVWVSVFSLLFTLYTFWSLSFDTDSKTPGVGEGAFLAIVVSFLVFTSGISVSFLPTEAFLRGLFVVSVLMMGLNYIHGHLKNNLNAKMILQFFLMIFLFLIIVFLFNP